MPETSTVFKGASARLHRGIKVIFCSLKINTGKSSPRGLLYIRQRRARSVHLICKVSIFGTIGNLVFCSGSIMRLTILIAWQHNMCLKYIFKFLCFNVWYLSRSRRYNLQFSYSNLSLLIFYAAFHLRQFTNNIQFFVHR